MHRSLGKPPHVRRCINNLNLTSTRTSWNLSSRFLIFLNIAILSPCTSWNVCKHWFHFHLGFCLYNVDQMFSSLSTIVRTRWFGILRPKTIQERHLSIAVFDYEINHTLVCFPSFPSNLHTLSFSLRLSNQTAIKHSLALSFLPSISRWKDGLMFHHRLPSSVFAGKCLSTVRDRGTFEAYLSPIVVRRRTLPRTESCFSSTLFERLRGPSTSPNGMSANNKSRKNWHVLFVLSYNLC